MRGMIRIIVTAAAVGAALLVPTAGQAGGAPSLAWSPSTNGSYDYGTLDAAASQTKSQTFTLTNSGGAATGMLTVTLSGSAAFTKTADGCSATSLGPKKSCSVTVQYAPTANNANDSATLAASAKKPPATASITLTGKGGAPDLTLSPGRLVTTTSSGTKFYDYSFQLVSGQAQTFTVTNSGTGTSETLFLANGSDRPFAVSNDTCSRTSLAPSGTCTFDVTFTAPAACSSGTLYAGAFDLIGQPTYYIHLEADQQCP